jgi:outer membrane protein, multidrug efflux system
VKLIIGIAMVINLLASCVPTTPSAPPGADLPVTYRGASTSTSSIADTPWQQLYADPVLQRLIATGLAHNLSAAAAYQAILAARANVEINRGKQQPQIDAELKAPYTITQGRSPSTVILGSQGEAARSELVPQAGVGISYEVDLFGRLASATSAARAQLLATQAAYTAVQWQLVATIASNYFTLREEDAGLAIAQQTLTARKQSLDLVRARYEGGISDLQTVRQSEESYYSAAASIPAVRRAIAQTEDALSTLIGHDPEAVPRGLGLDAQIALPELPATGVPSALLTRRPDIIQAEATLAASSANVDVARKMLYPQLTFSNTAGVGYTAINSAFYGPEGLFSIVPSLVAPLFNGGALRANVRLTQAQREQVAMQYLETVQQAMQEVADAIASYDQLREQSTQADRQATAAIDSVRLANLRYTGGVTSYLEVLDSQTRAYQAQVNALEAHLNERVALVQLYLALGGGWQ